MSTFVDHQRAASVALTSERWPEFWQNATSHRQIVTKLVRDCLPLDAKLCVWGAGLCTDIDLKQIVSRCQELTLVDIDPEAVEIGLANQQLTNCDTIRVVAPLDLAGIAERRTSVTDWLKLTDRLRGHQLDALGRYDMIVSTGMVSQIVRDLVELETSNNDGLHRACIVARRRHLELMLDHLTSDGLGLLVTDFLNSEQAPEIASTDDLQGTIGDLLKDQRFVGLDPMSLQRDLLVHPTLANKATDVAMTDFWLWRMTLRHYACFATSFRKRKKSS